VLALVFVAALPRVAAAAETAGVIVEQCLPAGAAGRAGVRAGDILVGWSRAPQPPANPEAASGELQSPFDLEDVEVEQAPRGPVTLTGLRDGRPMTALMPAGEWYLTVRPPWTGETLEMYERGRQRQESGDLDGGTAIWLEWAGHSDDTVLAAWLLWRVERVWIAARRWPESYPIESLTARLSLERNARLAAYLTAARAERLYLQVHFDDAVVAYDEGVALFQRVQPDSLAVARTLTDRAHLQRARGDLPGQRALLERVLEIRARQAPDSLARAETLARVASSWNLSGDTALGEDFARQALALADRVAPETFTAARVVGIMGAILEQRGALDEAERLFRRASVLLERFVPGTFDHGAALYNLASVRLRLGDSAGAEDILAQALPLAETHRLGGGLIGHIQGGQAEAAQQRGDLAAARGLYERALPNIASVQSRSPAVVLALTELSGVTLALGDVEASSAYSSRGTSLARELALSGTVRTASLRQQGLVAQAQGDLAAAREAFEQALEIDQRLAPGSEGETYDLRGLARLARADRPAEALDLYRRAVEALESTRVRVGPDPANRALYLGGHVSLYTEYAEALLDAGRAADAFQAVERSRARALLDQLTERELLDDRDLAPELARARREAEAEYGRWKAGLEGLDPATQAAELEVQRARLPELRRRLEDVAEAVRESAPRLYDLQYPRALDLAQVRQGLDPGTALVAYSVGEQQVLLFLVHPASVEPGLEVFRLPLGRADLRRQVDAFRWLASRSRRTQADRRELDTQARKLFELLLRPAWPGLQRATRVLVSPDDALWALPFAALRADGRYLADLKPVHVSISATLDARTRSVRAHAGTRGAGRVAAFGDPAYTTTATALPSRGSGVVRSFEHLGPLPATRQEVRDVARMYPGEADTYLGAEATEAHARALPRSTRIVHFACHALADQRSPMHSALILSTPRTASPEPEDDGLLEAWEIAGHMRLDAELVTLSACETGLGTALAGEGFLGLTRAFLHAGAHSVVSSLWQVSDESTRVLMTRFYRELRRGASKDEALRRAQASLLHGRFQDPFNWAGFQLQGDWR
jgi:CHAT domain-containing protein